MAITCPQCGASYDATLFQSGHRIKCPCGAEVGYPGADLRSGHVSNDAKTARGGHPAAEDERGGPARSVPKPDSDGRSPPAA
jgi:hypothetical protein